MDSLLVPRKAYLITEEFKFPENFLGYFAAHASTEYAEFCKMFGYDKENAEFTFPKDTQFVITDWIFNPRKGYWAGDVINFQLHHPQFGVFFKKHMKKRKTFISICLTGDGQITSAALFNLLKFKLHEIS